MCCVCKLDIAFSRLLALVHCLKAYGCVRPCVVCASRMNFEKLLATIDQMMSSQQRLASVRSRLLRCIGKVSLEHRDHDPHPDLAIFTQRTHKDHRLWHFKYLVQFYTTKALWVFFFVKKGRKKYLTQAARWH